MRDITRNITARVALAVLAGAVAFFSWRFIITNEASQPNSYPLILEGHKKGITSLLFVADGKRIVSGSDDGTVREWSVTGGKELFRYKSLSEY
jgi:WD40 repeat protein